MSRTVGDRPLDIAIVKYAGMSTGGTERWLQVLAASLASLDVAVTYYWSHPAPSIGGASAHLPASPARMAFLRDSGVRTVEFHVDAIDERNPRLPWSGTDFWQRFDPAEHDLVQTAKKGPPEYPYDEMPLPVIETVAYQGGVDLSPTIVRSSHCSEWSRGWWWRRGGPLERTFVVPIPVQPPESSLDLRDDLGISRDALVVGFHQRSDDRIYSSVQLEALALLRRHEVHLVVLGGSGQYRAQAATLGLRHAHFLPATADATEISRFLNTLDVFIHGRRDGETYGLVLAEAMRHGVPCLSHDVVDGANAQRETIGPGGMVASGPQEYAEMLALLLNDDDHRRTVRQRALAYAEANYTAEVTGTRMLDEYRSVLADVNPRPVAGVAAVSPGMLVAPMEPDDPIRDLERLESVLLGRSVHHAVIRLVDELMKGQPERKLVVDAALAEIAIGVISMARSRGLDVSIVASGERNRTDVVRLIQLNGADAAVSVIAAEELTRPLGAVVVVALAGGPLAQMCSNVAGSPNLGAVALVFEPGGSTSSGRWAVAAPRVRRRLWTLSMEQRASDAVIRFRRVGAPSYWSARRRLRAARASVRSRRS